MFIHHVSFGGTDAILWPWPELVPFHLLLYHDHTQRYSQELTIIIGKGLKVGKNALLSRQALHHQPVNSTLWNNILKIDMKLEIIYF